MVINWYGEGCFKIQTGGLSLLTDPFESGTGLTPPRGKVEVTVKTLTPWPIKNDAEPESRVISGAGEYEAQGVIIEGFGLPKESSEKFLKTVYKAIAEEITIGLLGHISEELTPEALDALRDSHIIVLPAGGRPFINQEAAAKLIKQLNPKIILASFFKVPGLKRGGSDWKLLAEELGQKAEVLEKLTIRRKEITEQKGVRFVTLSI